MAKTELTKKLEREIWKTICKMGTFGCFEVTIGLGWTGNQRVDFLSYSTDGTWRCFEIKVSKSDFRSDAKNTFIGHYNYYVMPQELFEEVKSEIPKHIGVYTYNGSMRSVKRATRCELQEDEQVLKDSLIRSLYRDVDKIVQSENEPLIQRYRRELREMKRDRDKNRDKWWDVMQCLHEKFGRYWHKEIGCKDKEEVMK
jgi:hypothetical protein